MQEYSPIPRMLHLRTDEWDGEEDFFSFILKKVGLEGYESIWWIPEIIEEFVL